MYYIFRKPVHSKLNDLEFGLCTKTTSSHGDGVSSNVKKYSLSGDVKLCTESVILTPVDDDINCLVSCDGLETALLGTSLKKIYIW